MRPAAWWYAPPLNPTPYTLHPIPQNLFPTPYTLYPTPNTPNPISYTLYPKH